jgi:benzodiazapine receptor
MFAMRLKTSRGDGKVAKVIKLVVCVLVCLLVSYVGSLLTTPSIPTWYAALQKPLFNPPNWIFAPVWLTLFVLMGLSAFMVWEKGLARKDVRVGLGLFVAQLALNLTWSGLFFALHSPLWAFVDIIALWVLILFTIIWFFKTSKLAGILMIPYILWVSFASALNLAIVILNG